MQCHPIDALSIATPSRAFAAEAVPTCNPTATNGCVNGILQDADKKPIANVELKLSGQEEATTTTDAEGKWAFSVNADGKYTVTMDESVAKDHGLKAATAEVEIQKNSFDKARQVVRFDKPAETSSTSGTSGSGSSSTSGSSSSSTASTGDDGSAASANIGKRVWQQLFSGIIFGLMLGLMSVGMNLVYGTTGLSSFSHGEQVSLGGLMAYVGTQLLHWPLIPSAIFAVVIGALTGWIQNELIWVPLRRKRVGTMQQMIVTIGLSMALQYIFQFFFGGDIKGITKSVPPSFQLGPITTDAPTLTSAGIAILVIIGVTIFLYQTRPWPRHPSRIRQRRAGRRLRHQRRTGGPHRVDHLLRHGRSVWRAARHLPERHFLEHGRHPPAADVRSSHLGRPRHRERRARRLPDHRHRGGYELAHHPQRPCVTPVRWRFSSSSC